jgi:tetratricopeptide (TPR) repeat protein
MPHDQQGLPLTGAPASAVAFDRALADYYGLTGDPVGALKGALAADPGFALGGVGVAGLYMIGGFRADHPEVTDALAAARRAIVGASRREQMHLGAVQLWADGRMRDAAARWEDILLEHPTDGLALRFAHDAYLSLGEPIRSRDSVARVLPAWDPQNPMTSYLAGQYAFALEETGDLARAEAFGREALAANPADAWAAHAVAHVLETSCRQAEGIAFLEQSRADWRGAHFMANHNGWHLALFLIEEGRHDRALADYDRFVAPKLADDATLDRIDAASLLWRLELDGVDVGDRWAPVARQWMRHVDDHVLAFNDLHLALAAARSPDPDDAPRLRRSLDDYARHGAGDNRETTVAIGRRLIDGVLAFGDGDYGAAIEAIAPARYDCIRIGGSHAQRDVIALTLIAAAERAGRTHLARALLAERAAIRPTERATAKARAVAVTARGE